MVVGPPLLIECRGYCWQSFLFTRGFVLLRRRIVALKLEFVGLGRRAFRLRRGLVGLGRRNLTERRPAFGLGRRIVGSRRGVVRVFPRALRLRRGGIHGLSAVVRVRRSRESLSGVGFEHGREKLPLLCERVEHGSAPAMPGVRACLQRVRMGRHRRPLASEARRRNALRGVLGELVRRT